MWLLIQNNTLASHKILCISTYQFTFSSIPSEQVYGVALTTVKISFTTVEVADMVVWTTYLYYLFVISVPVLQICFYYAINWWYPLPPDDSLYLIIFNLGYKQLHFHNHIFPLVSDS